MWHIHLIIWIKFRIYTQYVITAYCFIMYYNTEVQIFFATICNKYNPKSEKVGTVWKTQIKKESRDF